MSFMQGVYDSVRGKGTKVDYPEALEERALRAALGDRYRLFAARRARLVPYVW